MAVKVSTLNSKLPVASTIRWYNKTTKKSFTYIDTGEDNSYGATVRFKQPSTKGVSWQVRYRYRLRYKPSVAKAKKKAEWTKPSSWRTPFKTKYRGSDGKSKEYKVGAAIPDPKYWLKGNCTYVTSSTYRNIVTWSKSMGADYDAIEFEFAIRAYKKVGNKHGSWRTQKLKVYRGATIADEVLIKYNDDLLMEFNYKDDRGGSVVVENIVDGNGIIVLDNRIKQAPTIDTVRATSSTIDWYPCKRSGYKAGRLKIKTRNSNQGLLRRAKKNEKLAVTAYYLTKDGIKTYFKFRDNGKVYGEDITIPKPDIKATPNKHSGYVEVVATKTAALDGDDHVLTELSCSATYVVDGVERTIKPYWSKDVVPVGTQASGNKLGTWRFRPPFNTDVTYEIDITNEWGLSNTVEDIANLEGGGAILTGITYPDVIAGITYNASFSASTNKENITSSMVYGRNLPFVVFGKGRTRTFTLKGNVVDLENDNQITGFAKTKYIEKLAQNMGLYTLRWSDGRMFTVLVKSVDIEYGRVGDVLVNTVTIEMEEVSE